MLGLPGGFLESFRGLPGDFQGILIKHDGGPHAGHDWRSRRYNQTPFYWDFYRLTEATNCLDLMTAFADVSSDPAFVRPRFGPVMHVKSSRHPILDKMDLPGSPDIISNDITATPIEANFQVITGPNMSGKSTYLKQIVLLQVMAQSGCFVPALNEPQPMFRMADSIFSRVGMIY